MLWHLKLKWVIFLCPSLDTQWEYDLMGFATEKLSEHDKCGVCHDIVTVSQFLIKLT